jgi:hypothetical protein
MNRSTLPVRLQLPQLTDMHIDCTAEYDEHEKGEIYIATPVSTKSSTSSRRPRRPYAG